MKSLKLKATLILACIGLVFNACEKESESLDKGSSYVIYTGLAPRIPTSAPDSNNIVTYFNEDTLDISEIFERNVDDLEIQKVILSFTITGADSSMLTNNFVLRNDTVEIGNELQSIMVTNNLEERVEMELIYTKDELSALNARLLDNHWLHYTLEGEATKAPSNVSVSIEFEILITE